MAGKGQAPQVLSVLHGQLSSTHNTNRETTPQYEPTELAVNSSSVTRDERNVYPFYQTYLSGEIPAFSAPGGMQDNLLGAGKKYFWYH